MAVDESREGLVLSFSATPDPQVLVAGRLWILYNLERNQHFDRAYYYCS
jgi:hypothetical protein